MSTAHLETAGIEALLCDADGCLFPSEEAAFVPSTGLVNDFLAEIGSPDRFTVEELRVATTGMTFRQTISAMARERGVEIDPERREEWAAAERRAVTEHLAEVLSPDRSVLEPLESLASRFRLAVVSSSAHARLDACFRATGLDDLFPPEVRFSAEDSLPEPTSKPDPAVYELAGRHLGVDAGTAVAVEDSIPGVRSAVEAGFPTIGNLVFVPEPERAERAEQLRGAGAGWTVESWAELDALLAPEVASPR